MNASRPKASWITTPQRGLPFESTYANCLGPIPLSASACIVLVLPNVHEFATLITLTVITTLKILGKALIPASLIAIT